MAARWLRSAKRQRALALMLRSIAAREDGCCNSLRCAAMRLEAWGGDPPPHPSRRAHARPDLRQRLRTRAPQDEDGRARADVRLIAEPLAVFQSHDVKQPISFPRRIFASGVCNFASLTPNRGVGGAPRNVR